MDTSQSTGCNNNDNLEEEEQIKSSCQDQDARMHTEVEEEWKGPKQPSKQLFISVCVNLDCWEVRKDKEAHDIKNGLTLEK